jgi:multiple sugar transport system permease protein
MRRDSLAKRVFKSRWAYIFVAPAVIHFLVFSAYPIAATVYLSFVRFNLQGNEWIGMRNYQIALAEPVFWRSLANTALYTMVVVPVGIGIALFLSALIFPLRPSAQNFYKGAFYLPGVISAVVVSMIWLWMFDSAHGLLNYLLPTMTSGVIKPISWLGDSRIALPSLMFMAVAGGGGGAVILYLAAMGGIPATLYEAARIDGANRWTEFWRITLPLLKPTTLYLAIMGTIGSFQVFTSIYMMTRGGPNYATTTVVYRIYETAFEFLKLGRASAMALILALIIVGVSIVQFKVLGTEVEY